MYTIIYQAEQSPLSDVGTVEWVFSCSFWKATVGVALANAGQLDINLLAIKGMATGMVSEQRCPHTFIYTG